MTKDHDAPKISEIGCLEALEGLYAYIDGELDDPAAEAEIRHHMSHCSVCFSRTELEKLLSKRIRENAKIRAPQSMMQRLQGVLDDL